MKTTTLMLLASNTRLPPVIRDLFSNGQKGVVNIPHFSRYFFQDAAMTIPAVVGMPVLRSVCPVTGVVTTWANVTMQQNAAGLKYLAANGTSSYGVTTDIDFTGTAQMALFAGVRKASDAALGSLIEVSTNSGGARPGSCMISTAGQASAGAKYGCTLQGTSLIYSDTAASYAAPHTAVLTELNDLSQAAAAAEQVLRVNGAAATLTTVGAAAGTGNFGNFAAYFLSRAGTSLFMNGDFYGGIIVGSMPSAGQVADVERLMARYTGVNF